MDGETFKVDGYNITIYPKTRFGDKRAAILVLHGNGNLVEPFGHQIHNVAKSLAGLGYVTAVPQYYTDDEIHPDDGNPLPHVPTLIAAVKKVGGRTDVDPDRVGLYGYSLGAATAMTYIASNPGKAKVLVDFFGPTEGNTVIMTGLGNFPPTIIFHDKLDQIVPIENSRELHNHLPSTRAHELHEYTTPAQALLEGGNHAFREGGEADTKSRAMATEWITKHLPPTGT
jgi:dienelactone hydrolase